MPAPSEFRPKRAALHIIIRQNTDASLIPKLQGERWLSKHQICSVQQCPVKTVSAVSYYQLTELNCSKLSLVGELSALAVECCNSHYGEPHDL